VFTCHCRFKVNALAARRLKLQQRKGKLPCDGLWSILNLFQI